MPRYAVVDKLEGETPLMALERYRTAAAIPKGTPLTYAGRLDPMASGELLILIGDECKRRDAYDRLDKEYEFEVLFGFSSDTGDILGLSDGCAHPKEVREQDLKAVLRRLRGDLTLPYPAYSSKPVKGKPLFAHAREGTLDVIERPLSKTSIRTIHLLGMRTCTSQELLRDVDRRLSLLRVDEQSTNQFKDFRRDEIRDRWRELLALDGSYTLALLRATVGGGTYIRALAPLIAEELGACGLAYSIRRTRIGRFAGIFGRGLWLRSYEPLL